MTSTALQNIVWTGLLKVEAPDRAEFEGLVESGRARLREQNQSLALGSRFDLAYNAAHALSLAALRWHGYRAAKRYAVFQVVPHTLGLSNATTRVLVKCHDLRNLSEYEGVGQIGAAIVADLLKATEELAAAVAKLGPLSPQGSF
jgi:hypothetical protein